MAFEAVTVTTQEQGKHPAYNDILRTFKRHGTSYILWTAATVYYHIWSSVEDHYHTAGLSNHCLVTIKHF